MRRPCWYALIVPPQKEPIAELALQARGYDAFVPIEYRLKRVHSRIHRKQEVPYVLATRYVFLGTDGPVPWGDLLDVHLVRGIIGPGETPTCIPAQIMREVFDSGKVQTPAALNLSIKVGDRVRIQNGPFAGCPVSLKGIKGIRAKVILNLFNSLQEVETTVDNLVAL